MQLIQNHYFLLLHLEAGVVAPTFWAWCSHVVSDGRVRKVSKSIHWEIILFLLTLVDFIESI